MRGLPVLGAMQGPKEFSTMSVCYDWHRNLAVTPKILRILWRLKLASELFHGFFRLMILAGKTRNSAGRNSRKSAVAVGNEFGIEGGFPPLTLYTGPYHFIS